MRLRDILALDKELSKADTITLYRAYVPEDGKQIDLSTDGVVMYLSIHEAVQGLLNMDKEFVYSLTVDNISVVNDIKDTVLAIVEISIPVKGQKDKVLLTSDPDTTFNSVSGAIIIELNNFDYQIDVEEIIVKELDFATDSKTEIVKLNRLKYYDI